MDQKKPTKSLDAWALCSMSMQVFFFVMLAAVSYFPVTSSLILTSQDPSCPGTCTALLICKGMNGKMEGFCMDGKVCCISGLQVPTIGTCGSTMIGHKVSNFRSPNYPALSAGNLICEFTHQISPATVGIRVDFLDLHLPSVPTNPLNFFEAPNPVCDSDYLLFRGFSGWSPDFRCGNLTGYSFMIERESDQASLSAVFMMTSKQYRWNILLTEIYFTEVETLDYSLRNVAINDINFNNRKKQWYWYGPPGAGGGLGIPINPHFATPMAHATWDELEPPIPIYKKRSVNITEVDFVNATTVIINATLTEMNQNDEPEMLARIIGGVDAKPNAIPWQVSLQVVPKIEAGLCGEKKVSSHFCGGSIIGERTILTAAHCFLSSARYSHPLLPINKIKVVVGEHDLCSEKEVSSTKEYAIARIILHYNYLASDVLNDIALIHLTKPIAFDQNVHSIALTDEHTKMEAMKPLLSGWGSLGVEQNSSYPTILQQTSNLRLFTGKECQHFQREFLDFAIPDYVLTGKYKGAFDYGICTMSTDNLTEAGFGDSGGPLAGIPSGGNPVLLGVVSHMRPHLNPQTNTEFHLNYFTRVSSYRKWILMSMMM